MLYALLGERIATSLSPFIHHRFAQQVGLPVRYELQPVDSKSLFRTFSHLRRYGFRGINITSPFKQKIVPLLDSCTDRVEMGAVNTVIISLDGYTVGDNTDGIGWIKDIKENLRWPLFHQSILVIGAGGAARGILPVLCRQQPCSIVVANRTEARAVQLVEHLLDLFPSLEIASCGLSNIPRQDFDLIIHMTSSSVPPVSEGTLLRCIRPKTAFFDINYHHRCTDFESWCKRHHLQRYAHGLGMLIEQAAESFYRWHHIVPSTQLVRQELMHP